MHLDKRNACAALLAPTRTVPIYGFSEAIIHGIDLHEWCSTKDTKNTTVTVVTCLGAQQFKVTQGIYVDKNNVHVNLHTHLLYYFHCYYYYHYHYHCHHYHYYRQDSPLLPCFEKIFDFTDLFKCLVQPWGSDSVSMFYFQIPNCIDWVWFQSAVGHFEANRNIEENSFKAMRLAGSPIWAQTEAPRRTNGNDFLPAVRSFIILR